MSTESDPRAVCFRNPFVSESSWRRSDAVSFLRGLFNLNQPTVTNGSAGRSETPEEDSRPLTVGIVGTFDVENYGDLLFPLMAQAAFVRRHPSVQVLAFSPNRRSQPSWPFRVYSTADLPEFLPSLSALLIGGGQLIRFDKGYPVPADPEVNLPLAYWLIPAALGALIGKPVIWNAIGAWTDSPPAPWYDDVVNTVLSASYFVGVRDAASRAHLARIAPTVDIQVVPDTAFSLASFWPLKRPSKEYTDWRELLRLKGDYAVIQADRTMWKYRAAIDSLMKAMGETTAVILPICWCHGDRTDGFPEFSARTMASPNWISPQLIGEIVGRSRLVFASSLHACITGLSYNVPVVRVPSANATDRKFELLDQFEGVSCIDDKRAVAALVHRGRKVEPRVTECAGQLDRYWDKVMDVVVNPQIHHQRRSMALMLAWAPKIFEDMEAAALARQQPREIAKGEIC